jgi:NIPSNAP protein
MPVREKYSKNVGVFQTEVAQLNEVVHLWAYRDLNDRAAVRAKTLQDPEWQAFLAKTTPLLVQMHSVALTPVPASPMK